MATRPSSLNKSLMVGTTRGLYFLLSYAVKDTEGNRGHRAGARGFSRAGTMIQINASINGGQFLSTTLSPEDIYIREDLTDEQRMFGQTALEFMQKEGLPVIDRLYKHDWVLTPQLLEKASELG